MIWADRAGVGLLLVAMVFFGFLWAVGDGPGASLDNFAWASWKFGSYIAFPVWLVLRVIDFRHRRPDSTAWACKLTRQRSRNSELRAGRAIIRRFDRSGSAASLGAFTTR